MNLTKEQLISIYDMVFTSVHSDGFKTAEIETLLFDEDYWFLEKPKIDWYINLTLYLDTIGFDKSELKMNKNLKP